MANLKVPNLCGASPEFNAIQLEFENLIDDAVNKLEAEASAAVATATTIFNSLDTELKNLVPEIPELPDINLQSELVSLTALTPGTFEHTQLLAKIATDFEDALTKAGYELSTLVANALESISVGKDLCSVVPNFEKPADGSSEPKEKAVESKQATVDSVEEALSIIVPNAHIDEAKAALTTAINLMKSGVPFPEEQDNAYTVDVAGNPNLVSGTTPPTKDTGSLILTKAKTENKVVVKSSTTTNDDGTTKSKVVEHKIVKTSVQGGGSVTRRSGEEDPGFVRRKTSIIESFHQDDGIPVKGSEDWRVKLKHKPIKLADMNFCRLKDINPEQSERAKRVVDAGGTQRFKWQQGLRHNYEEAKEIQAKKIARLPFMRIDPDGSNELEIYLAGWEAINMNSDTYPQTKKSIEMVNFLRKQYEERKDKMFMVAYYYYANYDPNAIST